MSLKTYQVVILFLFAFVFFSGCLKNNEECQFEVSYAANQEQLQGDIAAIDEYLLQNNIEAQVHESGIRYVIQDAGGSTSPTLCNLVAVTYKGSRLNDGFVFDETEDPLLFPLNNLIRGWQIGIPLIQEGGSITLYIPSSFGYGATGAGDRIPPYTNLIFEIDLLDVR